MKTRFCPSPTGLMHLGNARTAFFSAMLARSTAGSFLLRVEDTDPERSEDQYVDALKADLQWLGLAWQEGPEVGGAFGPYFQSERQGIYDQYYDRLIEQGEAYPCFCSETQLAMARKAQRASGKPPRYPGTCRHLSKAEVADKVAAGLPATLRFAMPKGETITFHDHVRGRQRFLSDDIGDFVVRRTDGTAPFMYCNALDDALMGVELVVRGEDHLTNTPRQLLILERLGLSAPQYAHISLIVGPDGAPLSKRHGSRSLAALREEGFLPEALANYMARLGHTLAPTEFLSLEAIAQHFKLENLSKSAARFDVQQLHYWQQQAVFALEDTRLWQWLGDETQSIVPEALRDDFLKVVRPNIQFPSQGLAWAKCFFEAALLLDDAARQVIQKTDEAYWTMALEQLAAGAAIKAILSAIKDSLGVKGKTLFMPMRVALTGQVHGPEMADIDGLLSTDIKQQRLQQALTLTKEG